MRLWIDDERPAPDDSWLVAKTSAESLRLLAEHGTELTEVSFDHDLGGEDTTRPVLLWLVEHDVWPQVVFIHTANRVGREWLFGTASRYAPPGVEVRSAFSSRPR